MDGVVVGGCMKGSSAHRVPTVCLAFFARKLQSAWGSCITREMKAVSILVLALAASGCATKSKYAGDPRAAVVGPAYLDYIDRYPRDWDTQYYYPLFGVSGFTNEVDYSLPASESFSEFKPLLTQIPQPSEEVRESTGKGWPELERIGKPF